MTNEIGHFPHLGIDGEDLSDLVRRESKEMKEADIQGIFPKTRNYLYLGEYKGEEVVVKPYECLAEQDIVERIFDSPFSLIMDYNDSHYIERIAKSGPVEDSYQKEEISLYDFAAYVGIFLCQIQEKGIAYGHPLENHLFIEDGQVKATDFGESSVVSYLTRDLFISDIIDAFEFLRDNIDNHDQLNRAISRFMDAYAQGSRDNNNILQTAIRRHLKHSNLEDPLNDILHRYSSAFGNVV